MSQRRFGRRYRVTIQNPRGEQYVITPPLTFRCDITRNVQSEANEFNATIVNLRPQTRNGIFKDRYAVTEYWQVRIEAGYRTLHTVFLGNLYESYSYKEGSEWYTELSGYDGLFGIQNGLVAESFSAGTNIADEISAVSSSMPNVLAGDFGAPAQGQTERGHSYFGRPRDVLEQIVGDNWYIDGEKLYVADALEVIRQEVAVFDSRELLSTPRRRETFLDFEILFYPEINVGQWAEVRSLNEVYNGQYKVIGFTHNFEWSGAESGEAKTQVQLLAGAEGLSA